jgi:DNA-binding NtrC family response regulator
MVIERGRLERDGPPRASFQALPVLNRLPILIVEDEPYIALDLAFAVEDAGGRPVGPVAGVREALALLETNEVAAAILDFNLSDGDILPVVERLAALGLPMILQTGVGIPPSVANCSSRLVVHNKPCRPKRLVGELEEMLGTRGKDG